MNTKILARLALIGGALLFPVGCVGSAQSVNMIPQTMSLVKESSKCAISLTLSGGDQDYLPETAFHEALVKSLQDSNLFHEITNSESNYHLDVLIIGLSPPFGGPLTSTADVRTNWKLSQIHPKKIVWKDTIVTEHTATFSDAMVGLKRNQMAVEGAARDNIKTGIVEMSRLNLQDLDC